MVVMTNHSCAGAALGDRYLKSMSSQANGCEQAEPEILPPRSALTGYCLEPRGLTPRR